MLGEENAYTRICEMLRLDGQISELVDPSTRFSALYSKPGAEETDPPYRGNMLHHLIDSPLVSVEQLAYFIALLRLTGCDFYHQLDSNSVAPCLLAARRVRSYPLFTEIEHYMTVLRERS
jgi:hypothetical protein